MPNEVHLSDVVALLALLLSIYATWRTVQFNRRQESLIDSQQKINNIMLEKRDQETLSQKKADLGVRFVRFGNKKERLKIWNQGEAPARNIRIDFPGGNEIIIESDISEKFPMEILEKYNSIELVAAVSNGAKRKQVVRLIWDDDYKQDNEKTFYPTI